MNKKAVVFSLLLWFSLTGCGYRIAGTGKLFPRNIKTIAIPDFNNTTTSFQAAEYVTVALRDKFLRRSGLKLIHNRSTADSLLEGKILRFKVTSFKAEEKEGTRPLTLSVVISLRFIDITKNTVIYENQKLNFSHQYEFNSEDFFALEKESQDKIADKLASRVVTAILENF